MPLVTVFRTYLQMLEPPEATATTRLPDGVHIEEVVHCSVEHYRALYSSVGGPFHWTDRLRWSDQELARHLARNGVRIWVLRDAEGDGGYVELQRHDDDSVEVAYFGLLGSRQGRGLGRALLERAIAEAWRWGAARLWLHTCTLDGPAALPNYLARGFLPYKREEYEEFIPTHDMSGGRTGT